MATNVNNNNSNDESSNNNDVMKAIVDKRLLSATNTSRLVIDHEYMKAILKVPYYFISIVQGIYSIRQVDFILDEHGRNEQQFDLDITEIERLLSFIDGPEHIHVYYRRDEIFCPSPIGQLVRPVLFNNSIQTLKVMAPMSAKHVQDLCSSIYEHPTLTTVIVTDFMDGETNLLIDTLISVPNLQVANVPFTRQVSGILLDHFLSKPTLRKTRLGRNGRNSSGIGSDKINWTMRIDQIRGISRGLRKRITSIDLDFHNVIIPPDMATLFVQSTMEQSNVHSLKLIDYDRHNSNCQPIADSLRSNRMAITDLTIEGAVNATLIMKEIETNSVIQNLNLSSFQLDDAFGVSLSHVLEHHPSIKSLTISHLDCNRNDLDIMDKSIRAIQSIAPSLEKLKITKYSDGRAWLYPMTYKPFMDVVARNKTLKELILPFNFRHDILVRNTFIDCITSLRLNTTLETLYVISDGLGFTKINYAELLDGAKRNYGISNYGTIFPREIDAICNLNKAGRRYLLDACPCRDKGVNVLIGVRDDLDALYMHLLENPALCRIAGTTNDSNNAEDADASGGDDINEPSPKKLKSST